MNSLKFFLSIVSALVSFAASTLAARATTPERSFIQRSVQRDLPQRDSTENAPPSTPLSTPLSTAPSNGISDAVYRPNQPPRLRLGVFGGLSFNQHLLSLRNLPAERPELTRFTRYDAANAVASGLRNDTLFSGTLTQSVSFGILGDVPIMNRLRAALRLGYATHDAEFVARQQGLQALDLATGSLVRGEFVHTLSATLHALSAEALLNLNPVAGLQIYAGGRFGYNLQRAYSVGSAPSFPSLTSAQGDDRAYAPASGDLNTFLISIAGGVGYDVRIPLGGAVRFEPSASDDTSAEASAEAASASEDVCGRLGTLIVAPEIFGYLGMNSPVSGLQSGTWSLNHARIGLALKYEPAPLREQQRVLDEADTLRVLIAAEALRAMPLATRRGIVFDSVLTGKALARRDTVASGTWFEPVREFRQTRRRTDTLNVPPSLLGGMVQAFGVDEKGAEQPVVRIRVEEFLANRYLPLLNYVFFSENASDLPERYTALTPAQVAEFTVPKLYNYEPLNAYQQILNIVGRRMLTHSSATITLTGCNAGFGVEKGSLPLSLRRANTVRAYLQKAWGIDSTRIVVKARNLSANPSVPIMESDKIEENRRVEITSTMPEILEWIVTPDTLRTVTPPLVRFRLSAEAARGLQQKPIKDWRLTIMRGNEFVRSFAGKGAPPATMEWEVLKEIKRPELFYQSDTPFDYTLTLRDSSGAVFATETSALPVEVLTLQKKRREMRNDKEFEQFSLILFEFDRSELSQLHKRTAEFVKSRIRADSDVEFFGYTDRTGSEDYNRKLSERRARQIADLVRHPKSSVRGVGKDQLLYTNDIPEGRYYCRTVTVTIETPVQ
jgi:outer membrane protein OmpA-like peptidoglycan-associated protein